MNNIASKLQPFQNRKVLVKNFQNSNDIINLIEKNHDVFKSDYDKISTDFWDGNVYDTCKKLFDYCKDNIRYKAEKVNNQTVGNPSAILGRKMGDCKHYSSFIVGVLDSLKRKGYPVKCYYRFCSDRPDLKSPHHVFAVANDAGKEIWIDPVLSTFDRRKNYFNVIDKQPKKDMALYTITGLSTVSGKAERQARRAGRKESRQVKRETRKAKKAERKAMPKSERKAARKQGRQSKRAGRKQRTKEGKNKGKLFQKVGLAPNRNAFLLLLKMNAFRIASKLKTKINKEPAFKQELYDKWRKLGGNHKVLEQAIAQGVRVWNKHHGDRRIAGQAFDLGRYGWDTEVKQIFVEGIGEPVSVATAASVASLVSVAMGIILKMKGMLSKAGVDTDNLQSEGDEGMLELEKTADSGNFEETANDVLDLVNSGVDIYTQGREIYDTPDGYDEGDYNPIEEYMEYLDDDEMIDTELQEDEAESDGVYGKAERIQKRIDRRKAKGKAIPKGLAKKAAALKPSTGKRPEMRHSLNRDNKKIQSKVKTVIKTGQAIPNTIEALQKLQNKQVPGNAYIPVEKRVLPNGDRELTVKSLPFDLENGVDLQRDTLGLNDMWGQVKRFAAENKSLIAFAGVALTGFTLVNQLKTKKRR